MTVSKSQTRNRGPEQVAAVAWLQREIAWERVLSRLRQAAGVSPADSPIDADTARPAA